MCQRDHRYIDLHLVDLPGSSSRTFRVARDDQGIGLQRLYLGQRGRHVGKVSRQLVVDDDLHAILVNLVHHTGANVHRERVALECQSNLHALRVGRLFSSKVDCGGEILFRCRQHCEQVLVALREQRTRRALCLDHWDAKLFRHRRDCLGHARAVRPKHIFDAVLLDQAFGKLRTTRRSGFIVVILDCEFVALTTDLHAASLVDHLHGVVIAALGVKTVGGIFAGERDRRAEGNSVTIDSCHRWCGKADCQSRRGHNTMFHEHFFSSKKKE